MRRVRDQNSNKKTWRTVLRCPTLQETGVDLHEGLGAEVRSQPLFLRSALEQNTRFTEESLLCSLSNFCWNRNLLEELVHGKFIGIEENRKRTYFCWIKETVLNSNLLFQVMLQLSRESDCTGPCCLQTDSVFFNSSCFLHYARKFPVPTFPSDYTTFPIDGELIESFRMLKQFSSLSKPQVNVCGLSCP